MQKQEVNFSSFPPRLMSSKYITPQHFFNALCPNGSFLPLLWFSFKTKDQKHKVYQVKNIYIYKKNSIYTLKSKH